MEIWEPEISDEHCLKRELNNKEDSNAIAVVHEKQSSSVSKRSTRLQTETMRSFVHPNEMTEDMEIIAHVPKLMEQWVKKFLKRATNSATIITKGKCVNRGIAYGLELSCKFKFQGDSFSCNWLRDK